MISIVCFIGLVLMALGASAAEADEVHLQTLSVNGRLYTLPSTTVIVLDEEPSTLAALPGLPAGLQLRWVPDDLPRITRAGTPEPVPTCTLIGSVAETGPLPSLGQGITVTPDTVFEGLDSEEDLAISDAMIIAGLVDANGSLYATLVERRGIEGNKHPVNDCVQAFAVDEPRLCIDEQWFDTDGVVFVDSSGGEHTV